MKHGLVIGKFYPPHAGHELLVRTAAAGCDRVTVVAMAARIESVPLADRVRWLREVLADLPQVTVVGMPCDIPIDLESGPVWAAQVASIRAGLRLATDQPVDVVFSGESYGVELACRLGAVHEQVDPGRCTHPVSGTAVRADLAGHREGLHPAVRAGLVTRVVVLGAESTGTTTVSRLLAEQVRARGGVWAQTRWVPEYGRELTQQKMDAAPDLPVDQLVWDAADFAQVGAVQTGWEQAAAREGSPLLVCDTDAFATAVWERRYLGPDSSGARAAATTLLPRRDVYLLTDHVGVPWVDDGMRDGEHLRAEMTGWFVDALTAAGHSWALLTGTLAERVALALRIADQLLAQRATFTAPLG